MKNDNQYSRRDFIRSAGLAALGTAVTGTGGLGYSAPVTADSQKPRKARNNDRGGPYNILMIVTDQERYISPEEFPLGYRLPGHERLAQDGVTFENHQIGSCVLHAFQGGNLYRPAYTK